MKTVWTPEDLVYTLHQMMHHEAVDAVLAPVIDMFSGEVVE